MLPIATLSVPGEPRSKARPRVTRRGTFTPKTTVDYENTIRAAWDSQPRPDMPACVRLDVTFYLGTHRRVDVDNLAKCAGDALQSRAFDNDWRIHDMRVRKFYTTRDRARTEIHVYAIDADRDEQV